MCVARTSMYPPVIWKKGIVAGSPTGGFVGPVVPVDYSAGLSKLQADTVWKRLHTRRVKLARPY